MEEAPFRYLLSAYHNAAKARVSREVIHFLLVHQRLPLHIPSTSSSGAWPSPHLSGAFLQLYRRLAVMEVQVTHSSQASPQPSRLLRMPAEIRDIIWKLYVLAENENASRENGAFSPASSTRLLGPLRAVCQTTNIEVSPHAFRLTTFVVSQGRLSLERLFTWFDRIGTSNRLGIHQKRPSYVLNFRAPLTPSEEAGKWCRILQALPNLRHVAFPALDEYGVEY